MDWLIKILGGYTSDEVENIKENERKITKQFQIIADRTPETETLAAMQCLYEVVKENRCEELEGALSYVFKEIQSHVRKSSGCREAIKLLQHLGAVISDSKKSDAEKSDAEKRISLYHENIGKAKSALDFIKGFNEKLAEPISVFNLSTRTFNAFDRIMIEIAGEIAVLSENEIRQINNIGEKSFEEIKSAMEGIGFPLGCKLPPAIKNAINKYSDAQKELLQISHNLASPATIGIFPSFAIGRNGQVVNFGNNNNADQG